MRDCLVCLIFAVANSVVFYSVSFVVYFCLLSGWCFEWCAFVVVFAWSLNVVLMFVCYDLYFVVVVSLLGLVYLLLCILLLPLDACLLLIWLLWVFICDSLFGLCWFDCCGCLLIFVYLIWLIDFWLHVVWVCLLFLWL